MGNAGVYTARSELDGAALGARELLERTRSAQSLPITIAEPTVLRKLAALAEMPKEHGR